MSKKKEQKHIERCHLKNAMSPALHTMFVTLSCETIVNAAESKLIQLVSKRNNRRLKAGSR